MWGQNDTFKFELLVAPKGDCGLLQKNKCPPKIKGSFPNNSYSSNEIYAPSVTMKALLCFLKLLHLVISSMGGVINPVSSLINGLPVETISIIRPDDSMIYSGKGGLALNQYIHTCLASSEAQVILLKLIRQL